MTQTASKKNQSPRRSSLSPFSVGESFNGICSSSVFSLGWAYFFGFWAAASDSDAYSLNHLSVPVTGAARCQSVRTHLPRVLCAQTGPRHGRGDSPLTLHPSRPQGSRCEPPISFPYEHLWQTPFSPPTAAPRQPFTQPSGGQAPRRSPTANPLGACVGTTASKPSQELRPTGGPRIPFRRRALVALQPAGRIRRLFGEGSAQARLLQVQNAPKWRRGGHAAPRDPFGESHYDVCALVIGLDRGGNCCQTRSKNETGGDSQWLVGGRGGKVVCPPLHSRLRPACGHGRSALRPNSVAPRWPWSAHRPDRPAAGWPLVCRRGSTVASWCTNQRREAQPIAAQCCEFPSSIRRGCSAPRCSTRPCSRCGGRTGAWRRTNAIPRSLRPSRARTRTAARCRRTGRTQSSRDSFAQPHTVHR